MNNKKNTIVEFIRYENSNEESRGTLNPWKNPFKRNNAFANIDSLTNFAHDVLAEIFAL